jgi:hypothetical protein
MKAPTTLQVLLKLAEESNPSIWTGDQADTAQKWLQFTYELLTTRKTYHRKQQIRRKMLIRVAQEQLAPDELQEINRQATDLANQAVTVEVEDVDLGDDGPHVGPDVDSIGEG